MIATIDILKAALEAKKCAFNLSSADKEKAVLAMADELEHSADEILIENEKDIEAAQGIIPNVMLDRLRLTRERICDMASSMRKVASLPDPIGKTINSYTRDDGLKINKVSAPIGVVAVIYESRPNVTSDVAAICLKSGSVCILRGGKEAFRSAKAIVLALKRALKSVGLCENLVNLVEDTSRNSATELMQANGYVDLLIPRGGKGLIDSCVKNATVPCIQTGTGICHIYVDKSADLELATKIVENAKTSRPSVCNAAEVCLVDRAVAERFLPILKQKLVDDREKNPVELRLCENSQKIIDGTKASDTDFDTEFLDYILAVKVVDGVNQATEHILAHSTGHSEAIIATDKAAIDHFARQIDSAAIYVNASTRFTDGGEFGLGCEIGISTQKMHARGPMGIEELTTYKYVVEGNGHIR